MPSCDDTPDSGPAVWEGRSCHKPREEEGADDTPRLPQHSLKGREEMVNRGSQPTDHLRPLLAPSWPRSCLQRQGIID